MSDSSENMVREYIAFISYRHTELDKKVAKRIHGMIESYVIPKELRSSASYQNEDAVGVKNNKKLGKVFRDEEELPVSSNLTESIQTALDHSKFLIVICSPDTPESIWVEREIAYFIEHHDRDHVIGVLVEGTPDKSFPKLLTEITEARKDGTTSITQVEPLAANLTDVNHHYSKKRMKKEAVRLYAALLGCPFDMLWQRERRQKARNMVAIMALVLAIAAAFSFSMLMKNREITKRNEQIESQNERISEQYRQLEKNKDEIESQKNQIQVQYNELEMKKDEIEKQKNEIEGQKNTIEKNNIELSFKGIETSISEAWLKYDKGDMSKAIASAMEAKKIMEGVSSSLTKEQKNKLYDYLDEIELIVNSANGTYEYDDTLRTFGIIEQDEDIEKILLSPDGKNLYTLGKLGWVRCYSTDDLELKWKSNSLSGGFPDEIAYRQRLHIIEEYGLILICRNDLITALSLEDGSLKWSYDLGKFGGCDFTVLSDDLKRVAVIKIEGSFMNYENKLIVLNTKDGSVYKELKLIDTLGSVTLYSRGNIVGDFSEDGDLLAGVVYTGGLDGNEMLVFTADLLSDEINIIQRSAYPSGIKINNPFIIGLLLHKENNSVIIMDYEPELDIITDETKEKIGGVRCEQLFFDGTVENISMVPISVPERSMSDISYLSTFVPGKDNNGLLASCMGTSFIYRKDNGALISNDNMTAGNILQRIWIDEDALVFTYLDTWGNQHFKNLTEITEEMASFLDKDHIHHLSISDGYLYQPEENVFEISPEAVCSVVCEGEPRSVYILKSSKDPEISIYEPTENISDIFKVEDLFYNRLVVIAGSPYSDATIHIIDLEDQKEIRTVEVDASIAKKAVFSSDANHFSYFEGNKLYRYDMETGTASKVFETDKFMVAEESMSKSKEDSKMVYAALCYDSDNYSEAKAGKILVDIEGKTGEIPLEKGKNWRSYNAGFDTKSLWTGQEFIMTAVYDENGRRKQFAGYTLNFRESFYDYYDDGTVSLHEQSGYDISEFTVKDESTSDKDGEVVMSEYGECFAVLDKDNVIRIYDLCYGGMLISIDVPNIDLVESVKFMDYNRLFAVYTIDGRLYLYNIEFWSEDLPTNEVIGEYELGIPYDNILSAHELKEWSDVGHRIYISLDGEHGICLDGVRYNKVMDIPVGIEALSTLTKQAFKIVNGKLLCFETVSLDTRIKRLRR